MTSRSIITIAAGLPAYFEMAINLARSFEHWHANGSLTLRILTDLDLPLPRQLRRTSVTRIDRELLPPGFSSKLLVDQFMQTEECLFVDADCLFLGNVESIFEAFRGYPVGVLGTIGSSGEWFGDVTEICKTLGVKYLPQFNGAVYYATATEKAKSIYQLARALEPRYDEIGFVRLRGQPDEEMLMAASLAIHGVMPVPNPGNFYADFQWWPRLDSLNVLKGECRLTNPAPPDPRHQNVFPATTAEPLILHFLGCGVASPEYREASLAFSLSSRGITGASQLARIGAGPRYLGRFAKNTLRPLYRRLFGVRPIKASGTRYVREQ